MKSSLDYSQRALEIAPEQIHFKFNIAFVQIQLAQLMYTLPDNERTLAEVEAAADGLDQAIESFGEIAKAKNPPYPRHDIEQRANMGRNTMRRQLERAVQQQRDYEERNKAKLAQAREVREAELRRREEERRAAEDAVRAEKERLTKERQKLLEESRALAEKRAEEERRREDADWTVDSEGEKVKRRRKGKGGGGGKRKKKGEDASGTDGSDADGAPASGRKNRRAKTDTDSNANDGSGEEKRAPIRKKRRLARKPEKKMKSSELVIDSDSDGEGGVAVGSTQAPTANEGGEGGVPVEEGREDGDVEMADADRGDEEEEEEDEGAVRGAGSRRQKTSRMIDDDDEEEEEDGVGGEGGASHAGQNGAGKGNVFADAADISMVDESVAAAGNADAVYTERLDPDAF